MSLNRSFISDFSEYYRWSQRTKIKYELHYGWCTGRHSIKVSSIKDNLAKLNEELIDNDELQEKLDGLTNQFYIKYDDFKQKINVIKHETEEGIANMQTELETTGNEVKTNTAEKIRIAESISSVKRDLDILSSQLA